MDTAVAPNGRKSITAFGIVWFGQLISFVGSGLASFAIGELYVPAPAAGGG